MKLISVFLDPAQHADLHALAKKNSGWTFSKYIRKAIDELPEIRGNTLSGAVVISNFVFTSSGRIG